MKFKLIYILVPVRQVLFEDVVNDISRGYALTLCLTIEASF